MFTVCGQAGDLRERAEGIIQPMWSSLSEPGPLKKKSSSGRSRSRTRNRAYSLGLFSLVFKSLGFMLSLGLRVGKRRNSNGTSCQLFNPGCLTRNCVHHGSCAVLHVNSKHHLHTKSVRHLLINSPPNV